VAWLTERAGEGPVYVHCALGHGRSATVVVAYLVATGRAATVQEGLASLRSKRPGVSLLAPQLDVLMHYSRVVAGERG
jgi:protein-tyrosine phosphatase